MKKILQHQSALIKSLNPKFQLGQIVKSTEEGDFGVVITVGIDHGRDGGISGFAYTVAFPEPDQDVLFWPDECFDEADLEAVEVEA